jgi:hypothetical protein
MSAARKRPKRPQLDMNNLPRGLRPEEAARVIGLSEASYYRHVHPVVLRGDILSVRVGRSVRIITPSLLDWWEQQAIEQRERWKR